MHRGFFQPCQYKQSLIKTSVHLPFRPSSVYVVFNMMTWNTAEVVAVIDQSRPSRHTTESPERHPSPKSMRILNLSYGSVWHTFRQLAGLFSLDNVRLRAIAFVALALVGLPQFSALLVPEPGLKHSPEDRPLAGINCLDLRLVP